ncbi:4Fe-4S binding protein, partial [bacterium]|nr:4Fe-4S binding protein [bacterium]
MRNTSTEPLVTTIKERCRLCYTCVRECPAKAIRIEKGQAEVLVDRCIGCGNCVKVCSQKAKKVRSSISEVEAILDLGNTVHLIAIVAPSFPAEFSDMGYNSLVGMVRALGFQYVLEVASGADAVAAALKRQINKDPTQSYIDTSCPAIVAYILKYHPNLVSALSPVVSPMVATARIARKIYGQESKVVFIGPCIAKKNEAS